MLTTAFQLNYSSTAKLPWSPLAYHPSTPRTVEWCVRTLHRFTELKVHRKGEFSEVLLSSPTTIRMHFKSAQSCCCVLCIYIVTTSGASAITDNRLVTWETKCEMDAGGNKPDHMVSWVWLVSLPEGDQWPHSLPWWRQSHGADSMGKRRENKTYVSCLPASLPDIWGEGLAWFRKPLPIVLLPSLVVVSTVWIATRVPLFLFCCTTADLTALMFWQIVSKSHQGNLVF